MSQEQTSVRVRVTGRVQGVSYRMATVQQAERLGVTGWVRNEPDGTVLAHVQGPAERVEQLLDWCRSGPSGARVDGVDVCRVPAEDLTGFDVRH